MFEGKTALVTGGSRGIGAAIVQRLGAAGVPVTLEVWDRQVHVFQAAADILPEAARAVARIGSFVRYATGSAARSAVVG